MMQLHVLARAEPKPRFSDTMALAIRHATTILIIYVNVYYLQCIVIALAPRNATVQQSYLAE